VLGHISNALIVQQKRWKSPTLEERIYTASFIYTVYTVYKILCPNVEPGKTKAICRSKGKNKKQIAALITPSCP
jgi:hypothetical protein